MTAVDAGPMGSALSRHGQAWLLDWRSSWLRLGFCGHEGGATQQRPVAGQARAPRATAEKQGQSRKASRGPPAWARQQGPTCLPRHWSCLDPRPMSSALSREMLLRYLNAHCPGDQRRLQRHPAHPHPDPRKPRPPSNKSGTQATLLLSVLFQKPVTTHPISHILAPKTKSKRV